jgi:hypothetical protein
VFYLEAALTPLSTTAEIAAAATTLYRYYRQNTEAATLLQKYTEHSIEAAVGWMPGEED